MTSRRRATPDYSWETEGAPKVSKRSVVFAAVVYAAWVVLLAFFAGHRWLGALQ